MKMRILIALCAGILPATAANADLIIHAVIDGPLALDGNGGDPKAIVVEATADIADLSIYGIGTANNGGGSDGQEFSYSGSATAGDLIVITADTTHSDFLSNAFPSIALTFEDGVTFINGDDPFELYMNGSVIDTFGDVALDGTGEPWEYVDTYFVRTGGTAGAFDINNYTSPGVNALDNLDEAGTIAALEPVFGPAVPEPTTVALALLGFAAVAGRKRG